MFFSARAVEVSFASKASRVTFCVAKFVRFSNNASYSALLLTPPILVENVVVVVEVVEMVVFIVEVVEEEGRSTTMALGCCCISKAADGTTPCAGCCCRTGEGEARRGEGARGGICNGGAGAGELIAIAAGDIEVGAAGGGEAITFGAGAAEAEAGEAVALASTPTLGLNLNLTTPGAAPDGVEGVAVGEMADAMGKGEATEGEAVLAEADGVESVTDSFNGILPDGVPVAEVEEAVVVVRGAVGPTPEAVEEEERDFMENVVVVPLVAPVALWPPVAGKGKPF